MTKANIPDPQLVEREALDESFYDWYSAELKSGDPDNAEYYADRWNDCVHPEPLVFSAEDIYESYDDPEEGWAVADLAMSKDLQEEIEKKRQVLFEINNGQ